MHTLVFLAQLIACRPSRPIGVVDAQIEHVTFESNLFENYFDANGMELVWTDANYKLPFEFPPKRKII